MTQPPKCPKCGAPLETVQIERVTVLGYDEDEKEFYDNGQGSGVCKCGACGQQIGGYGGGRSLWGCWVDEDGAFLNEAQTEECTYRGIDPDKKLGA